MAQNISVKVRNKESGDESTITYKAFQDVQSYFELLGQIDNDGNLIPGDPNLLPQHQRRSANVTAEVKVKAPVFNSPVSTSEINEKKVPEAEKEEIKVPDPVQEIKEEPKPEKRKYNKRVKETA